MKQSYPPYKPDDEPNEVGRRRRGGATKWSGCSP